MSSRWGKSLNLDTLIRFLSLDLDKTDKSILKNQTENYILFTGDKINARIIGDKDNQSFTLQVGADI